MLAWLVDAVKGLLGGKGTTQIGKGNQSVSGGSTAGANSPVVTAGRDVHFNVPPPPPTDEPKDGDAETFAELEGMMPELLAEMRKDLAASPLARDVILLDKKTMAYNWPGPHFRYSADETPDLWAKIGILEDRGFLRETRDRFSYRMSGPLVKYLTKR